MKKYLFLSLFFIVCQLNYSQTTVTPQTGKGSVWIKVDCNGNGFCERTEITLNWGKVNETRIYNWASVQMGTVGCIIELKYYGGNLPCKVSSTGTNLLVQQSSSNPWSKDGVYDVKTWSSLKLLKK